MQRTALSGPLAPWRALQDLPKAALVKDLREFVR